MRLLFPQLVCAVGNAFVDIAQRALFKRKETQVSAIVVYRHCFVGDFVVIVPALRRLRAHFPDARIVLLATSSAHRHWRGYQTDTRRFDIAKDCIDEVIEFKMHVTLSNLCALRAEIKKVDASHYLVLPFSSEGMSGRLKKMLLLKALGVRSNVSVGSAFGTLLIAADTQAAAGVFMHQVDAALHAVDKFIKRFPLLTNPVIRQPFRPKKNTTECAISTNKIVFAPSTKQPNKQWPAEHFATLITRVLRHYPEAQVELIGGPGDLDIGNRIMELAHSNRIRNRIGELTISESADLIRRARMFIGLDSGPMHIASLYDVPSVAIFPSVVPLNFWRPWGKHSTVVAHRTPCASCYATNGDCPKRTFACIRDISVESVFSEVTRMWHSSTTRAA